MVVVGHAKIKTPTQKLAAGGRAVTAKCRCGWTAMWPRTQREAADAYRAHRKAAA